MGHFRKRKPGSMAKATKPISQNAQIVLAPRGNDPLSGGLLFFAA